MFNCFCILAQASNFTILDALLERKLIKENVTLSSKNMSQSENALNLTQPIVSNATNSDDNESMILPSKGHSDDTQKITNVTTSHFDVTKAISMGTSQRKESTTKPANLMQGGNLADQPIDLKRSEPFLEKPVKSIDNTKIEPISTNSDDSTSPSSNLVTASKPIVTTSLPLKGSKSDESVDSFGNPVPLTSAISPALSTFNDSVILNPQPVHPVVNLPGLIPTTPQLTNSQEISSHNSSNVEIDTQEGSDGGDWTKMATSIDSSASLSLNPSMVSNPSSPILTNQDQLAAKAPITYPDLPSRQDINLVIPDSSRKYGLPGEDINPSLFYEGLRNKLDPIVAARLPHTLPDAMFLFFY
eukprot:NODE_66_length_25735_cov_0.318497.p9 type:complete len:358 gc:universal NODE_66_length_25735_cov_0.318497:9562-8489(-)